MPARSTKYHLSGLDVTCEVAWTGSDILLAARRDATPERVPFARNLDLSMVHGRQGRDGASLQASFASGEDIHILSGTFAEGSLDVFCLGDPAVVDGHHLVARIDVIPERRALEVWSRRPCPDANVGQCPASRRAPPRLPWARAQGQGRSAWTRWAALRVVISSSSMPPSRRPPSVEVKAWRKRRWSTPGSSASTA